MSIRTFDNDRQWQEKQEWRFFYVHLQMVMIESDSLDDCALMREVLFIGNGREERLAYVVPLIGHTAWDDEQTLELKRLYDKRRKQFAGMRWDGRDHRAGYRDWLFRKHFDSQTELMGWATALKPWGVDAQRLWDLFNGRERTS